MQCKVNIFQKCLEIGSVDEYGTEIGGIDFSHNFLKTSVQKNPL